MLSNTVREVEKFGVKRSRKAVHDWIHKCNLQSAVDENPNYIALDEMVIQLNEHHYWLYSPYLVVFDDYNRVDGTIPTGTIVFS